MQYMSPEQVLGKEPDARTDLFSLGVVLYEMTTGRLPFSGGQASEVTDRILHAQPEALARFNYDVPAELDRIIRKCLEKDRERRYQSARDLLIDLKNIKRDSDSGKGPEVLPRRERWRSGSRFAVPAGAGPGPRCCWCCWLRVSSPGGRGACRRARNRSGPSRSPPYPACIVIPRFPQMATTSRLRGPDRSKTIRDIYVQQIGIGNPLPLTKDPGNDYSPVWSPDGRWIAFLRGQPEAGKNELRLIPPLGGTERKLGEIRPQGEFLGSVSHRLVSRLQLCRGHRFHG